MRWKALIVSFSIYFVTACTSVPKPLPPSEFLLFTAKAQTEVLNDLKNYLKENKYEVSRFDYVTGILGTKPRSFAFDSNRGPAQGEQVILIRQESGSVKLRMEYRCQYPGKYSDVWSPCEVRDDPTISKIERIENILLPLVAKALHKKTVTEPEPRTTLSSQVRGHR
jgi:hypothetical protein